MQGTVVMLMALSGLGCHNKSCDVAYAPPTYSCFGGGCYANVYPSYVAPSSLQAAIRAAIAAVTRGCYARLLWRRLLRRLLWRSAAMAAATAAIMGVGSWPGSSAVAAGAGTVLVRRTMAFTAEAYGYDWTVRPADFRLCLAVQLRCRWSARASSTGCSTFRGGSSGTAQSRSVRADPDSARAERRRLPTPERRRRPSSRLRRLPARVEVPLRPSPVPESRPM